MNPFESPSVELVEIVMAVPDCNQYKDDDSCDREAITIPIIPPIK